MESFPGERSPRIVAPSRRAKAQPFGHSNFHHGRDAAERRERNQARKRRHQVRRRGVSACASKSTPDASQNRSARRLRDFTDQFVRRLANPADHRTRRCSDPTVRVTRRLPFPADQPTRRPADPFGPSHPKVFWAGNQSARRPSDPRAPPGPKTVWCARRHSE